MQMQASRRKRACECADAGVGAGRRWKHRVRLRPAQAQERVLFRRGRAYGRGDSRTPASNRRAETEILGAQ
ncbi:hypothetical protein GCM10018966_091010 [Streptomyces yanii]